MATTIGIFAHVDAGKTSLSEQILYRSGTLLKLGRVDAKCAFLDHDEIERSRGITVFADEAPFSIGDGNFFLIDTPGHADFGGEMERSMCAIDCAILVISAVEGIQSHTETIWRLLRKSNIPTVIFFNKTDRDGADIDTHLRKIHEKWSNAVIPFYSGMDTLREELATVSPALLDAYFNDAPDFWALAKQAFLGGELFPALRGSALHGDGVDDLLCLLERFCAIDFCADTPFSARVYKIRHDKNHGRLAYLKLTGGTLHARDTVNTPDGEFKINELRRISGGKSTSLTEAYAGELVAVRGLSSVMPGDIIGDGFCRSNRFDLTPLLSVKLNYPKTIPTTEMLSILRELEDEEPLYRVVYQKQTAEIHLRIMGEIQLEVLKSILESRYGIEVTFGECEVLYKETIEDACIGCGHFEPLRHYAEVHLRLDPAPRGSGITFASECPTDILALNWQRLIETHVNEKEHLGVLIGAPLCDVKVTLLIGRAHIKHTEGGDFREATYRAIRQGLMGAKNILLEPWLSFEIEVTPALSGRILTDVQSMGGKYETPEAIGELILLRGSAPARTLSPYVKELVSISSGNAHIALSFDNYYPCANQDEIVASHGYDPERDVENTPDSVFCSHGAGFPVKWSDAPSHMNCSLK